jgi:tetratricopeptide (TPR) repeat protein
MILRLSSNAQRGVLVGASCALALILSFFSIRNALAAYAADLQTAKGYERATRLESSDPRNWYLLGRYWQYNLEDYNASRAISAYRTALSLDPRSADVWLDLAAVYESEGNLPASREAFLLAKKDYPLSAEVSWRYGNFLLRQGEFGPASGEMRQAIQADPNRAPEAFSRSLRAGLNLETTIERVLPPITEVYVDVIWDQTTDRHTEIALKVWNRLILAHPRVPLRDVDPLIHALRDDYRFADAQRVWAQAVGTAGMADVQGPPGSVLWDGGFESGITGVGYSWFLPESMQNLQISIDDQEKHSGSHSLRMTFDGRSVVSATGICHFVPVRPLTVYRFSAWVKTREITTDQGVRFQLRSLGTEDSSVVVTPELHGSAPWTNIEIPWSSGKDVHEVQACLVRSLSDQLENKIKGTTWVDDVALVPEAAEGRKP